MSVFDVESKRQRRPNVRLAGDFVNPQELEYYNQFIDFPQRKEPRFRVSQVNVIPGCLVDMQQNKENLSPDSTLDQIYPIKSKVDNGAKDQEYSVVKKGRRSKRSRRTIFGHLWSSEASHTSNAECGEYGGKVNGFSSSPGQHLYDVHSSNDLHSIGYENSPMSKEDWGDYPEMNGHFFEIPEADATLEGRNLLSESHDRSCQNNLPSVGRWLEELGFGRYAGAFEMHEVDEEALPLLTVEDLKEMGILAVGPRRKLYAAIQRLRDSTERA